MPLHYSCCVPNCRTSGPASIFLSFPFDPVHRQEWLSAIPKHDWVVDHSTVICINHFKAEEVGLNQINNLVVTPRAVPSVFPSNTIQDKPEYYPKYMFEVKSRDGSLETFGDLENYEDPDDFIMDFYFLKKMHRDKLNKCIDGWHIFVSDEYVLFYLLTLDGVAKIKSSIKINKDLVVAITLSGRLVDPFDLTRFLPVSSKITRWSQLQMLLREFGDLGGATVIVNM